MGMSSGPAQTAFDAGVDMKPSWANGAKVLVQGLHPGLLEPPTLLDELRPWHVILATHDEDALLEHLKTLPYNIKKMRPHYGRLLVPEEHSLFGASSLAEWPSSSAASSDPSPRERDASALHDIP